MKEVVTLYEHPNCPRTHYNLGGVRRCNNNENGRWVQEYEQGTYYLLTPEEIELIRRHREGTLQCSPLDTATTKTP